MNLSMFIGRLTKDPEVKFVPGRDGNSRAVINGSIAVDRDGMKDESGNKIVDFIPFSLWGVQAENCGKYCSKGDVISFSGRMQSRSYENASGEKRTVLELNVTRAEFLPNQKKQNQQQQGQQVVNGGYQPNMQNGGHQPNMQNGGHQPNMQNGGHQPNMQNGGYQPNMQNGGYQPNVQNGGYQPNVQNEGYPDWSNDMMPMDDDIMPF